MRSNCHFVSQLFIMYATSNLAMCEDKIYVIKR